MCWTQVPQVEVPLERCKKLLRNHSPWSSRCINTGTHIICPRPGCFLQIFPNQVLSPAPISSRLVRRNYFLLARTCKILFSPEHTRWRLQKVQFGGFLICFLTWNKALFPFFLQSHFASWCWQLQSEPPTWLCSIPHNFMSHQQSAAPHFVSA